MLSLEIMPPLMFGGLVVFLLIGFPVAFSLAATGCSSASSRSSWASSPTPTSATCRCACSASCPTTCCWRSRSSP
jgi:hypothetical protein